MSDFMNLDSRSVSSASWVANTPTTFSIANPAAYRYYRLYITANGGNGYTGIRRLQLNVPGSVLVLKMRDNTGNIKTFTAI